MKSIVKLSLLLCFLLLISCNSNEPAIETEVLCNGSTNLCSKKYNEVVFACTHNAYNYPTEPANFILPNQNQSIQQQLNDGIRALMLDVYYADENIENTSETIWLYHSISLAGYNNLENELKVVANFLKNNPTEIITLILECYVEFPDFEKALANSELTSFLYNLAPNGEWLTLQKMIETNQRLVVLTDVDDAASASWYIYVWDVAFETHYSNKSRMDFSCNPNRGDTANDLFIFNHFITQATLGTGLVDSSVVINQYDYLLNRLNECQSYHDKLPNFVTVDFYDSGNVMQVVNQLNGL